MKRLVIIGVATFVVGLVVMLPARVVYHLVDAPGIRLSGIEGTVWHGSATEGAVRGLYFRDLRWRFRPAGVLTGRLGYGVNVEPAGGYLAAEVSLGPAGDIRIRALDGAVSIAAVRPVIPAAGIDGTVRLDIGEAVISDGAPASLDGVVEISNLSAAGLSRTPIGDFRAEFSTTADGIIGSIDDAGGMLDIAGTLKITPDRAYVLSGLVAPTPTTPSAVVDQLQFLGSPNERGQRQFRFEGRL